MSEGILDLYGLLVEQVFGGVGLAIIAVAVLMIIIGAISKKSQTLIIFEVGTYLMVMAVYYSEVSFFLITAGILIYTTTAFIRWNNGGTY